jgi:PIN domain nuclease of toxin-antitoxin system
VTRLLLDTHAFLWFITDDDRLTTRARHAIIDADHALVSIASCWEIAIKASLGKLTLSAPPDRLLAEQLAENSFDLLHLDLAHISRVPRCPGITAIHSIGCSWRRRSTRRCRLPPAIRSSRPMA